MEYALWKLTLTKKLNHSLLSNNVLLKHYPKRYKQTKNCDDEKVEIFGTTCCGWNKVLP